MNHENKQIQCCDGGNEFQRKMRVLFSQGSRLKLSPPPLLLSGVLFKDHEETQRGWRINRPNQLLCIDGKLILYTLHCRPRV